VLGSSTIGTSVEEEEMEVDMDDGDDGVDRTSLSV
jgi:hypothetical protein